jgi:cell division septal protein FtsQ
MQLKNKTFFILLISILAVVYLNIKNTNDRKIYFPIKNVSIESKIINVSEYDVFEKSKNYLDSKSFFNFKINILKKEIEKVPWVKSADIRRVYPGKIKIYIEEHTPIAIWNNKSYVNDVGDIFLTQEIKKNLPVIISNQSGNKIMFLYFSLLLKYISDYNFDIEIKKIEENDIRSLSAHLSSGIIVKFGSKDIRNKIHAFVKIYNTLNSSDLEKIGYIDMRYSNGFSIGWKSVK